MNYFCHTSYGRIYQSEDGWLFVHFDPGVLAFYYWLAVRQGLDLVKGSKSGPHISIVKKIGSSLNQKLWKDLQGQKIKYHYSNDIRYNDVHAWINIDPEPFNNIRKQFKLPLYNSFHSTIGRFKYAV